MKVAVGGGDEEVGAVGAGVLDHRALLDLTGTSEPMCLSLDKPLLIQLDFSSVMPTDETGSGYYGERGGAIRRNI